MMLRSFLPRLLLLVSVLSGCRRTTKPSDRQMMERFECHAPAFERLRALAAKYPPFHYPPLDEGDSTVLLLAPEDRQALDSLLGLTGIERLYYEGEAEVRLMVSTWGLAVSGGYKEYIYAPSLQAEMKKYSEELAQDPVLARFIVKGITNEDLDQVARRYSKSLDLYRPLGNAWYLHLSREY